MEKQREYHDLAKMFRSKKKGRKGKLMTRKSMEDLLRKLTNEQKNNLAANKPVYGEISYDRAVNEMFEERGEAGQADGGQQDEAKGMALLYRADLKKTEDVL